MAKTSNGKVTIDYAAAYAHRRPVTHQGGSAAPASAPAPQTKGAFDTTAIYAARRASTRPVIGTGAPPGPAVAPQATGHFDTTAIYAARRAAVSKGGN